MINRNGFSIVNVADADVLSLPSDITHNDSQLSKDGELMWVKGTYDCALKVFDCSSKMFTYCYTNGWAKPEGES